MYSTSQSQLELENDNVNAMPVSSLRAVLRRAEQERERRGRRGGRALPSFDAAGLRGRVLGERGLRRVVPRGRQHHRRLHLLLEGQTNHKIGYFPKGILFHVCSNATVKSA